MCLLIFVLTSLTIWSIFEQSPIQNILGDTGCWIMFISAIGHNLKCTIGGFFMALHRIVLIKVSKFQREIWCHKFSNMSPCGVGIEYWPCNPRVSGSIPGSSNLKKLDENSWTSTKLTKPLFRWPNR